LTGVEVEEYLESIKNEKDRQVARMLLAGMNGLEMAKVMGVNRAMVNLRVQSLRTAFNYSRNPYEEKFKMTKQEYLQERLSGKSRSKIHRESGVNLSYFYKKLKQWGIKEPEQEAAALDEVKKWEAGAFGN
jgi:transposase-like protein